MDFFKKRQSAVVVFVAVVALFSLIGCHLSLGRACRHVEEAFFDKALLADYNTYTCPGDQLDNCVKLSNRLLSVINGQEALSGEYEAVLQARLSLDQALDAGDISDIYDANAALVSAVAAVDEQVTMADMPLHESSDDYFKNPCPPCGACRQVLSEFNENMSVVLASKGTAKIYELKKLLPHSFTLDPDE